MHASTGTEQSTPTYMPAANRSARRIAEGMTGIPQSAVTEVLFNTPLRSSGNPDFSSADSLFLLDLLRLIGLSMNRP
jgi:hypothetical protein